MREGKITPNWTYLVQSSSQSVVLENIDFKDTWFNPDLEEDTIKNSGHVPRVAPDNNRNTLISLHIQESTVSERVHFSEVINIQLPREYEKNKI